MAKTDFSNKRILLTGASTGMGRQLATMLLARGATILATARSEDKLKTLREETAGDGHILAGDLTDEAFRRQLVNCAEKELGGVDILINNAGIGAVGRFEDSSEADFRQLIEINLIAPVELTRMCLPMLRRSRRPHVVNVCSVLAYCGVPEKVEYCATKFALRGFSDALRAELRQDGIAVTVLNPSTIASEFWTEVQARSQTTKDLATEAQAKGISSQRAARYAVDAIAKQQNETAFPISGKMLVWLSRLFPRGTNYFAARTGGKNN